MQIIDENQMRTIARTGSLDGSSADSIYSFRQDRDRRFCVCFDEKDIHGLFLGRNNTRIRLIWSRKEGLIPDFREVMMGAEIQV